MGRPKQFKEVWRNYDSSRAFNTKQYFLNKGLKHVANYVYLNEEDEERFNNLSYASRSLLGKNVESIPFRKNCHPIGIDDVGRIVAIPNTKEARGMAIYGLTGTGKSTLFHNLFDGFYQTFNHHCTILNDYHNECFVQNLPSILKLFRQKLDFIGQKGVPLPIVLVVPNIKDKTNDEVKIPFKNVPVIKMKIPWVDFIENIGAFVELGESQKYVDNIKETLLHCSSPEEVKVNLEEGLPKKMRNTRDRVLAVVGRLFREEIINFDKNSIGYLRQKDKGEDRLFPSLLRNNLFPILVTPILYKKEYIFSGYLKYILDDLINRQRPGGDSDFGKDANKRLAVGIDEMNVLFQCEKVQAEKIKETIVHLVLNGRMFNTSLIFCAQHAADPHIDEKIKTEARFIFAFQSKGEDAIYLKKNLGLTKYQYDDLKNLKPLECYATTDEFFYIYDGSANPKKEKGPIKLKIIPPLSQHLPPTNLDVFKTGMANGQLIRDYPYQEYGRYTSYTRGFSRIKDIKLYNPHTGENILIDHGAWKSRADQAILLKEVPRPNEPRYFYNVDYMRAFYGDSFVNNVVIDYSKLKSKGYYICKKRCKDSERTIKGQTIVFVLRHIDEIESYTSTSVQVYQTKPAPIVEIIYNKMSKEAMLIGKYCSRSKYKVNI